MYGDGGGKAPARRAPVRGALEAARLLSSFARRPEPGGWTLTLVDVNGRPGAMVLDGSGSTVAVMSIDIADGAVQAVRAVVDPDKLRHLVGGARSG